MIVRRVEIDDYKEMMELLKEFGEEYGGPAVVEELSLERVFMRALHTGVGFVALNDGKIIGGIGGVYMPNPYNELLSMLTELYWYVKPEFRGTNAGGRLFLEYEKAGFRTAHGMVMTLLDSSDDSLDNGLKKRGYKQKERTYIKWRRLFPPDWGTDCN